MAVLFDRDGTLVVDVPYRADPALVTPLPAARAALALLRAAGIRVASSPTVRDRPGLLDREQVARQPPRRRAPGPFDVWQVRRPRPRRRMRLSQARAGMLLAAASRLGVAPADVASSGHRRGRRRRPRGGRTVGAGAHAPDDAGGGRRRAGGAPRPARPHPAPPPSGGEHQRCVPTRAKGPPSISDAPHAALHPHPNNRATTSCSRDQPHAGQSPAARNSRGSALLSGPPGPRRPRCFPFSAGVVVWTRPSVVEPAPPIDPAILDDVRRTTRPARRRRGHNY